MSLLEQQLTVTSPDPLKVDRGYDWLEKWPRLAQLVSQYKAGVSWDMEAHMMLVIPN
jgi:predicted protein tyrosine phosphatase